MNGTPTWQWRMEGNRIRFGTGLSLFGGRGPSIPYYPDSLAYVAKQDLDTGEVILSQSRLGPTIVLTRVDAGDADDSDTPTE